MKLIYNVQDKPTLKQTLIFAFQQIIAIMAATLLVPLLISGFGLPADPAAALCGAGVGTLVYILLTRKKSPVFLGSTFTFLGAYAASIGQGYGYWGILLGILFAGLVYVVIAIIVKSLGSSWVNRMMPPVIIGPIVALIGLSLSGTATSWMATNGGADYSLLTILCGLVTFLTIVLASVKGTKNMKLIPFIIGVGAGYVLALVLTLIGKATGNASLMILDFTPFVEAFGSFSFRSLFDMPDFFVVKALQYESLSDFTATDIGNIALIYVPIAVVELAQHIADHKNLGSIIERDLIKDPGLDKTLLGDGIGSIVGGFFGGCANTTYGESIGCVAITGNASIVTIVFAALGCVVLSFITPFVVFINSIPKCVMGGACIAMYGFIAVSGLQMLRRVDLGDSRNLFVVSAILVCGIGGLTFEFGFNPLTGGSLLSITSLAVALIVGVIVNLIVNDGKLPKEEDNDYLSGHVDNIPNADDKL